MFNKIINKTVIPLAVFIVLALSVSVVFVLFDIREKFNDTIDDKINYTINNIESKLNLIDDYVINQVQIGMNYLKRESLKFGSPNIDGNIEFVGKNIPNMKFGNLNVTMNYDLVDGVQKIVGGTATIFVKSGDEFVRITTNVKKSDGSRAIGTILDPQGKAIKNIRQSQPFYGYVSILEQPYITGYEPIYDNRNQVIGIFYVGYPLTTLTAVGQQISSTKLFTTGFVALIDDKNNVVYCSENYKPEDIKSIIQDESRLKDFNFKEIQFSKWNYKLFAAVPYSEIDEMSFTAIKSSLISNVLIFSIIIIFLSIFLNKIIIQPIKHISNSAKKYIDGDKNVKISLTTKDELGQLGNTIDKMIQTIENNILELERKEQVAKENAEQNNKLKLLSEEKNRQLEENISNLLIAMEKFSSGYLEISVSTDSDDEQIKKLFKGFNDTVNRFKELVSDIINLVDKTSNLTTLIASNTQQMAAGSQELSSQVHEIASAIEQMSSTIIQTTKNTNRTAENSRIAVETANNGGKVVNETISGIEKISEVVYLASENIKQLGESSKQIGEIVQVINEIADQTNLLALNAAIEAARAGEQGRGFAVVADEVRKLAERTTKATKEIATMIKKIQTDTEKAVLSVNAGNKEVEEGKKLAEKAKDSLKDIIHRANEVVDLANQVAVASEEQSATIEQISRNVENMSNVTNESAQGIQKIAQSIDELNRLTDSLRESVSLFKLSNERRLTNNKFLKRK